MISKRLKSYFDDYRACHKTRGNRVTHAIGIPLIVLSLLGLLSEIDLGWGIAGTPFRFDGGVALLGGAGLFYLWLDWRRALPFGLVLMGIYFLGRALPPPWLWGLFVFGWVLQGIGHFYYEKRSPAFFRNLTHLLIGPFWIFCKRFDWD